MRKKIIVGFLVTISVLAQTDCFIAPKKLIGVRLKQNVKVASTDSDAMQDHYFDQFVDHFNGVDTRTWKQRYFVNGDYFKKNGPVFLMISGESVADPSFMIDGYWIELAQTLGALCVMLEHRYYGITIPTPDLSTENLKYLSSRQALEDLATFRQFIQQQYNLTDAANRWIVFGGSYAGALSAWLRLKYPNLIYAAVASSAPVQAVFDFQAYFQVVGASLTRYSSECTYQIQQAINIIDMFITSNNGKVELLEEFALCTPILSQADIDTFYWNIAGYFAEIVQYNDLLEPWFSIESFCDIMTDETLGNAFNRLVQIENPGQGCFPTSYKDLINSYTNSTFSVDNDGSRQWLYQTCTEFGYFQSSDSPNQPFGSSFPISYISKQCLDVFGFDAFKDSWINSNIENTNNDYGGLNYQGSRVVFVNGDIDPWHALSFTQSAPNNQTQIIYINGTAHCADMSSSSSTDSIQLTNARLQIANIVSNWINSS